MKSIGLLELSDLENHYAVRKSVESFLKYHDNNVVIVNTQKTPEINTIGKDLNVIIHNGDTKFDYPVFSINEIDRLAEYIVGAAFEPVMKLKTDYFVFGEPDCIFFNKTDLSEVDDSIDILPPLGYENNGELFWVFKGYWISYGKDYNETLSNINNLFSDLKLICQKYGLDWDAAAKNDMRFVLTCGSIIKTKKFQDLYINHKDKIKPIIKDICWAIYKNKPVPEINPRITSLFSFDILISILLGLHLFKWQQNKNYRTCSQTNFPDEYALQNFLKENPNTHFIHSIKLHYANKNQLVCEENIAKKLNNNVENKSLVYDFDSIWNECLQYNIEQKPEEFKMLMDTLTKMPNRRYALEIGSNYGGLVAGLCSIFDKVITIDIKHNENFDKIKSNHSNYDYILGDSKSNDTLEKLKALGIKFDFIFIDGDHSYEGVKNDYEKYKQLLSPDGYLGFHDILTNPFSDFGVDRFWKEVKGTYKEYKECVCVERSNLYRTDNLFHQIVKNSPYGSWGGIGLLKNSPVAVFSHNYLGNHWKNIVYEQLDLLISSGLYHRADKILYGVFSEKDNAYYDFIEMIKRIDAHSKIEVVRYEKNIFEYPTLIHLQTYCSVVPNAAVCYYNAKGTSRPVEYKNLHSWRKCLEYFNIELWEKSVKLLNSDAYDVCGALYVEWFAFLHYLFRNYYSGNFWWANAKYINTLPNLSKIISSGEINRTDAEMWIGKSVHRWASYYGENVTEWYNHYFDPNVYRKIT